MFPRGDNHCSYGTEVCLNPLLRSVLHQRTYPGLAGENSTFALQGAGRTCCISSQGQETLHPLPGCWAALWSFLNLLFVHCEIPQLWLSGGSQASPHLDDTATSSKQRLLISLISTARALTVSGRSSKGSVWHGGYKRQMITALIRSFIPFLQAKRLHAEREETARSCAESTAASVRQLCCSRQGLLGQTGDCR